MTSYEDDTILLDDEGVTITSYRWPGDMNRIGYTEIQRFERFEMGFWTGRHRLVGISPGRPRSWFHWDRDRKRKRTAISLDVGRLLRPTIVPVDPDAVEAILRGEIRQP